MDRPINAVNFIFWFREFLGISLFLMTFDGPQVGVTCQLPKTVNCHRTVIYQSFLSDTFLINFSTLKETWVDDKLHYFDLTSHEIWKFEFASVGITMHTHTHTARQLIISATQIERETM